MTTPVPSEHDPSLLLLVLDLASLEPSHLLDPLLLFLNAFLLLHKDNRLLLAASHPRGASVVCTAGDSEPLTAEKLRHDLGTAAARCLLSQQRAGRGTIAGAVSMMLCRAEKAVRRAERERRNAVWPRILVLQANTAEQEQRIPFMNAVFAAQKKNVPIDTCVISRDKNKAVDMLALQQASHLTNGVYLPVPDLQELTASLFMSFLPDRYTRQMITVPLQTSVDFRAVCFCHHSLKNRGFVCPVCLSVFCKPSLLCAACGSRFPPQASPLGKRKNANS